MSEIMNQLPTSSVEFEIDARLDGLVEAIMRDNGDVQALKEYEELLASRVRRMRPVGLRKRLHGNLVRKFA
jgi:hypothetical protein